MLVTVSAQRYKKILPSINFQVQSTIYIMVNFTPMGGLVPVLNPTSNSIDCDQLLMGHFNDLEIY
jgi:hypothetical protein